MRILEMQPCSSYLTKGHRSAGLCDGDHTTFKISLPTSSGRNSTCRVVLARCEGERGTRCRITDFHPAGANRPPGYQPAAGCSDRLISTTTVR